ncbi:biotin carboxylase N-terminal domain-containing protein [Ferrimicrobium sp.]|uniref:acetyl/propionyl/methylcrotonyl-CoA carboxylase subunit alpha n=1 Tax=Ferrimicrobium sp. TaxID=2926050 RepID=UPI0026190A43|nr:biotin carboxylase N-terminal domain-containing protein [Ferrimicrobium sp.]
MFERLLVANRGEIAVRVMRTAREMGITTIAVYSDADRDSMHVRYADEAYNLPGTTVRESYLNTERILEIIKRSGAQAVHPGYGFFSENTDFARAIESSGVVFVGPPPKAIEIMGDKISSRIAATAAGVAGVPGTAEVLQSAEEIITFGNQHGWPVAIKAAYGGGGRGMRVVHSASEAADALSSAQREALASFGRDECYLERYLAWPRHVEMQIIGDTHGNIVWLGERDCSCQRRHQKLIEESPAPDFPNDIRVQMGEAAVKVAKACGYYNAGTVEFLYQDGQFYFLEMNTRLQVEHPITEAVTGLDLVELQLRVAAGEPLGFAQHEVTHRGHAIEIRLNAEDPSAGRFIPSPGPITRFDRADGPGVRTDAGYEAGDAVSQYYDNLIAKLVVWAPDRERAIARAVRALHETKLEGVTTTIPADLAILTHPDFAAAQHSTKWVEDRLDLSALPVGPTANDTDTSPAPTEVVAEVNGKRVAVKLFLPDVGPTPASRTNQTSNASPTPRSARPQGSTSSSGSGSGNVTVPMQGTVVKVSVEVGQEVQVGDTVIVLEAMKMENSILAERNGTISEIKVQPGDTVGTGDVVAVIS